MPPTAPTRPSAALPLLCYALLIAAWIVDLLTPQLFVAAILLNGPIALSSLTLEKRLTNTLVVLAEIANVVAGYVNGVQAGHQWNGIAIGDRVLLAASFMLVGYLSNTSQEFARSAGESQERARQVDAEVALRAAIARVRASLNVELVFGSVVRESIPLLAASRSLLVVRDATMDVPLNIAGTRDQESTTSERKALTSELATLVARAGHDRKVVRVFDDGAIQRMMLAALDAREVLVSPLPMIGTLDCTLLVMADDTTTFSIGAADVLAAFSAQAAIAIEQARIFTQLGERNREIALQKDELGRRGDVIRDIVYALAHDLRTPLTAADVTMKQAMAGSYGDLPEKYREILKSTLAANEDQRRLVETLLLVARYEAGEESNVRVPLSLNESVARVVADAQPVADVQGVTVSIEGRAAQAPILGDPTEIRRAIGNLLANAVEATPSGGAIVLRIDGSNGRATIAIEDTGYGVPVERRPTLFERFGGTRAGAGTGLGLYIVRRIVEKHGGTVAYAPAETRGSIFTITLPLEPA